MTFATFKRQISLILKERCDSLEMNPLLYGIERNIFEEQKLKRLVTVAEKANCVSADRRKEAWLRQLGRVRANRLRMEKMRDEIAAIRSKMSGAPIIRELQGSGNLRKNPTRNVALR